MMLAAKNRVLQVVGLIGLMGLYSSDLLGAIVESAREIPVIADVDVVVVGGTFGAVGAATAAKNSGASVFVVAPRQALGEEVVAPRDLWFSEWDEGAMDPLVYELFPQQKSAKFTYTSSVKAASNHPDNNNTVLRDWYWQISSSQSAQYNSDVTFTITPDASCGAVKRFVVSAFHRDASDGFTTESLEVLQSEDGSTYSPVSGSISVVSFTPQQMDPIQILTFTLDTPSAAKSYQLVCKKGTAVGRQLLGEIFVEDDQCQVRNARAIAVETALDQQLLNAQIPYLTGSPVTGVLRDENGVAGVVFANRSGRQAVRAKCVIDATEWGGPARIADFTFRPTAADAACAFSRTIVCQANGFVCPDGYTMQALPFCNASVSLSPADLTPATAPSSYSILAYRVTKEVVFPTLDDLALGKIQQQFLNETWNASTVDASERLSFTPPDQILSAGAQVEMWSGITNCSLTAFQPQGSSYFWVAGPCADVARAFAGRLRLPGNGLLLGRRIGEAAAAAALTRTLGTVTYGDGSVAGTSEVRERLSRPMNTGNVTDEGIGTTGDSLPVLGETDVAVVGLGTAGAPAAIAAAREGVRVTGIEFLYAPGGAAVENRIGRYYEGWRRGFTAELEAGVTNLGGYAYYNAKAEWLRRQCRDAQVDLWFGSFAEGVVTEGVDEQGRAKVTGVVVVLPSGKRGVLRASIVIDSTGNADLAAAAGNPTTFLTRGELALQGASASYQPIGQSYHNTDVSFLNDTDAGDVTRFGVQGRLRVSGPSGRSMSVISGSRERRRVVGDYVVSPADILRGQTYPDTIMHGKSNFDMHGYSTSLLFHFVQRPSSLGFTADLPFRALLPKDLDGMIATGLGISAHRDAMPILRMQPDVQNQGYAAGLAAAAAVTTSTALRTLDLRAVQQKLIALGALEARVLTDQEKSIDEQEVADAVAELDNQFLTLAPILEKPELARSALASRFVTETDAAAKYACAVALTLTGDLTAVPYLRSLLTELDEGFDFKGMGNYGRQTSKCDTILYALASCPNAMTTGLIEKWITANLNQSSFYLSHLRALSYAVNQLPSSSYTALLTALGTKRDDFLNHAQTNQFVLSGFTYITADSDTARTQVLRELAYAQMLYRIQDPAGVGEAILRTYAKDVRGAYAAVAQMTLDAGPQPILVETTNMWVGTEANGVWTNTANWSDGIVPSSVMNSAAFPATDTLAQQTISLGGATISLEDLILEGITVRLFEDGIFQFGGNPSELSLQSDATISSVVRADQIRKTGAGTLQLTGATEIDESLVSAEGCVSLGNRVELAPFCTARVTGGAMAQTDSLVGYGFSFTVKKPIWVTHLGCYDATPEDGLVAPLHTYLHFTNNYPIAAVKFSSAVPGFVQNGYRFQRLPKPVLLNPATYSLRSFGYCSHQPVYFAPAGDSALNFSDVNTILEAGNALLMGTNLTKFTTVVSDATSANVTAANLLFVEEAAAVTVPAKVTVDAELALQSPIVTLGGLEGTGVVSSASFAPTLLLESKGSSSFSGTILSDQYAIGLEKDGIGKQTLRGTNTFGGGVMIRDGVLALETVDAIGSQTPVVFGDEESMDTKGYLEFLAPEVHFSNPIRVNGLSGNNVISFGIRAKANQKVVVEKTEIGSVYPSSRRSFNIYAKGGDQPSEVVVQDTEVSEWIDLVFCPDGTVGKKPNATITVKNLTAPNNLRKLVCANTVSNSVGGTLNLVGPNQLATSWLDLGGRDTTLRLTNEMTLRANTVRFVDNIWSALDASNAKMTIEDGSRLICGVYPQDLYRTTNSLLRFDAGTLQILNEGGTTFDWIRLDAKCPPVEVAAGGVVFDLASWTDKTSQSARIRHPMSSPADTTSGPVTLRNGGTLTFAAPMSYHGPTIVEGGTLAFDLTQNGLSTKETLLKAGTELYLAGGGFSFKAANAAQYQQFSLLSNATEQVALVDVQTGSLRVNEVSLGAGLAKSGDGTLEIALIPSERTMQLNAPIQMNGGVLALTVMDKTNAPLMVAQGDFEPDEPLKAVSGTGDLDRRAQRNASYFQTEFPSWTFEKSDNVGIAGNGSYFVMGMTNGSHCAFIRSTGVGISTKVNLSFPSRVSLSFLYSARVYNNIQYTVQYGVSVDGTMVKTFPAVKESVWREGVVDLGLLPAGDHVIRFVGVQGNTDGLLDDVRIQTVSVADAQTLAQQLGKALSLDLQNGAKLSLGFEGDFAVPEIRLNGEKQYGTFSAETVDWISGPGVLHCYAAGSVLMIR